MQNRMSSNKQRGRTVNIPLPHVKRKKKRKRDRDCCLLDVIFDGCFVATAAYESPVAEPVRTLRRYRDKRLTRNRQGSAVHPLLLPLRPVRRRGRPTGSRS